MKKLYGFDALRVLKASATRRGNKWNSTLDARKWVLNEVLHRLFEKEPSNSQKRAKQKRTGEN